MINSGIVRNRVAHAASILLLTLAAVACNSATSNVTSTSSPDQDQAETPASSIASPTAVPTTAPTAKSASPTSTSVSTTPTTVPPTATPVPTATATASVPESQAIPTAVQDAVRTFVEVQSRSGGEGVFTAHAVILSPSGLLLTSYNDVTFSERNWGFGPRTFEYQAAIVVPGASEKLYPRLRRLVEFADLDLMFFQIEHGAPWLFAEIPISSTIVPGDAVYSIGIPELERWRGSTAPTATGPQVIQGIVISIDEKDGLIEIEHSTDLSEIPGAGPLFDEEGRLVGFNVRSSRSLGPDGFEPRTFAVSSDEFRDLALSVEQLLPG